jgi:hypothetical protein
MSGGRLELTAWKQNPAELDFRQRDKWFTGGQPCHRYPRERAITPADILFGWAPPEKIITRETKVLAFGSCFAEYFIRFLTEHGYNRWRPGDETHALTDEPLLFSLGGTFENVFVIVQQLRWAFGEFTPPRAIWFTKDKTYFEATEERRLKIRRSFEEVDVLVVTLGLSEIWFDCASGEPMWRPILSQAYEPARHIFRLATVAETVEALREFDRLAEAFLPGRKVIFTLSPVPLLFTFRDQSPVTANQVSKAILRVALDEFLSADEIRARNRYCYFPSYELALNLFGNPYESDNRHVRPEVAKTILDIFSAAYTDLPVEAPAPGTARDEVSALRENVRALELELVQKEAVIREVHAAAEERLAILQRIARDAAAQPGA